LSPAILSDAQWRLVAPLLPGKPGDRGRSGTDNRLFFDAVLWMARTGSPWRTLDKHYGPWNSTFRRFRRWASSGAFERAFGVLVDDPGFEYAIIDGSIVWTGGHATDTKVGLKLQSSDRQPANS
jgi:transposase